ncbi:hypothetical protein CB1_001451045 [Camelus ferus]|nr:hypothetical protein CB1_001451045 [Camelus ferus]
MYQVCRSRQMGWQMGRKMLDENLWKSSTVENQPVKELSELPTGSGLGAQDDKVNEGKARVIESDFRLRALSSGGSITSPPLSPALPKYKLADYRYGREEMLALFLKDNKIPSDLLDKEFLPILQEEPLPPLALVPFTEEEQRNFSMSVNSAAVLRLTGRGGGGTVVGAPRGRSSSRGRVYLLHNPDLE